MSSNSLPTWAEIFGRRLQPSESDTDLAAIGIACGRLLASAEGGSARPFELRFGEIAREAIDAAGLQTSLFFPRLAPWPEDHVVAALAMWRDELDRAKTAAA